MADLELPTARGEEREEEETSSLQCSEASDPCEALMGRYARSSAVQHRHLLATAAAMRSILVEERLPLTPPAYFAAAITAFRDLDRRSDSDASAALAGFISILLPLVSNHSLPPKKAEEASVVISSFLVDPPSGTATGTVRSMVKSLGLLVMRVDLDDWRAVEPTLNVLLMFAVDRRPKVRRCAQVCVEKVFKTLRSSMIIKKASKVVLHMYNKYITTKKGLTSIEQSEAFSEHGHTEILHMLNVLKFVVPNLSEKVRIKILSDVHMLLGDHFSWITRHVLGLLEGLLEHSKTRILVPESESIISALTSYISVAKKNPTDTIISASVLLRNALNKLHARQPSTWITSLPPTVNSIAGLLGSDATISKHATNILKELINIHIDQSSLHIITSGKPSTPEEIAVVSICKVFDNMLDTCKVPAEDMLAVISVLFLKLGEFSYCFMKKILLKLSQRAMHVDEATPDAKRLKECIGAAVIAMGPEKLLSLIPIALNAGKFTCSNTWLIPILKKYVVGASLQYYMQHIVPLAKSIQNICIEVNKEKVRKRLKSSACGLWSLLPAFCRYPTDTSQSFESLAKLLIVVLKEDQSLHESIAIALKELVNENKTILSGNEDVELYGVSPTSFSFEGFCIEAKSLPFHYSMETASRNIKALSSNSMGLFHTLVDVFFDTPEEKCVYLKEAIGCFASIIGGAEIQNFFLSLLEKFVSVNNLAESKNLSGKLQELDKPEEGSTEKEKHEDKRCLLMKLASSLVKAADADLINLIFDYVKASLMTTSGIPQSEAYYTLSIILKEHSWFCSARIDELVNMLLGIKSSVDNASLTNRLLCFHYLLVHILQGNEDKMDTNAFLILNEIILRLKSKKESRKLAYDVLLNISASLKSSESAKGESDLLRLFNMVMGYLSSSSPHIMSGAVSALSLLIFKDAHICLSVPNLIPSVLALLQKKDNEVIKATLGFIKVLVTSLNSNDLSKILTDIVKGILPWSSVSKHHFRSKVVIIFEILIRKCGYDTIDFIVPGKYKSFLKKTAEARHSKKPNGDVNSKASGGQPTDSNRGRKRVYEDVSHGSIEKKHTRVAGGQKMTRKHDRSFVSSTNETIVLRSSLNKGSRNSKNLLATRPKISMDYKNKVRVDLAETPRGGGSNRVKAPRGKRAKRPNNVATRASKSNKHQRL